MTFDVHPIFVHFPIALLTVYALMECLRFPKLLKQSWWMPTKAVLLIIGVLGAFAALQTGEIAEEAYRDTPMRDLVDVHSTYATAATWVFSILAVLYLLAIISANVKAMKKQTWFAPISKLSSFILDTWWIIAPLAIIGLILITITGALGGAIVYGSNADPIVSYITTLLGVQ